MARLLSYRDFGSDGLDPTWWFADTRWSSSPGSGTYLFDISTEFPHQLAIHRKHIGLDKHYCYEQKQQALRVEVRKFVEKQCCDDVFYTFKNMEYDYLMEKDKDSVNYKSYDAHYRIRVEHGYMLFHFASEADAILFRLRFADYVRPIEERHRDYADNDKHSSHTEENIQLAKEHRLHWGPPDWTNK